MTRDERKNWIDNKMLSEARNLKINLSPGLSNQDVGRLAKKLWQDLGWEVRPPKSIRSSIRGQITEAWETHFPSKKFDMSRKKSSSKKTRQQAVQATRSGAW